MRKILNPVEAAVNQQKLISINQAELKGDLMAGHRTVKHELILSRTLDG